MLGRTAAWAWCRKQFLPTTGGSLQGALVHLGGRPRPNRGRLGQLRRRWPRSPFHGQDPPSCAFGIEVCGSLGRASTSGDLCLHQHQPHPQSLRQQRAARQGHLPAQPQCTNSPPRCLATYACLRGPGREVIHRRGLFRPLSHGPKWLTMAKSDPLRFDTRNRVHQLDLGRLQHKRLCNASSPPARPPPRLPPHGRHPLPPAIHPLGTLRPTPRCPSCPPTTPSGPTPATEIFAIQSTAWPSTSSTPAPRPSSSASPAASTQLSPCSWPPTPSTFSGSIAKGILTHPAGLRHDQAHTRQRREARRGNRSHAARNPHPRRHQAAFP